MRNRSVILRQLTKENLDPKIAYVLGKNGKLIPKIGKETKLDPESLDTTKKESESSEFVLPDGAKSIPESLAENVEISKEITESIIEEKAVINKNKSTVKKKSKTE